MCAKVFFYDHRFNSLGQKANHTSKQTHSYNISKEVRITYSIFKFFFRVLVNSQIYLCQLKSILQIELQKCPHKHKVWKTSYKQIIQLHSYHYNFTKRHPKPCFRTCLNNIPNIYKSTRNTAAHFCTPGTSISNTKFALT